MGATTARGRASGARRSWTAAPSKARGWPNVHDKTKTGSRSIPRSKTHGWRRTWRRSASTHVRLARGPARNARRSERWRCPVRPTLVRGCAEPRAKTPTQVRPLRMRGRGLRGRSP
eukprot:Amastigsp_a3574_31.p2 type:complete len:116 gc:universal Amastigsp_a3574_31:462-115(-)